MNLMACVLHDCRSLPGTCALIDVGYLSENITEIAAQGTGLTEENGYVEYHVSYDNLGLTPQTGLLSDFSQN